jgi:hypothetical protein
MLLTGSGDEFCGLLPTLLQTVAYHPPAVGLPTFPAVCLLIVCMDVSCLPLPPSSALSTFLPLCCVLVFSSLFIVQFCGGGVSLPRGYAGLSRGGWGNTT